MSDPDLLEVARIGKPHGVRGDVILRLLTDRTERAAPGAALFASDGREFTIRSSRPHQKGYIVSFKGIDGRNAAEAITGTVLYAPPLDDDDVLWVHELIGRAVHETNGTDRGVVVEVEANPASDLLVLDSGALVPLTFMVEVTDDAIVIDPPPGLFDIQDD